MQTKQYTGLAADAERFEWTVLRQTKEGCEVADEGEMPISPPNEQSAQERSDLDDLRGTICTAVPVREALLRIVELPSNDRDELAGMVELQIGKISPFPVEELVVSFEVLTVADGAATVLIAAARRAVLEKLRDEIGEPRHIDVDLMGWWYAIGRQQEENGGRIFNLILHSDRADLVAADAGVPVLLRGLTLRDDLDGDEYLAAVAEELQYSTIALEADWGEGEGERVVLYAEDEFSRNSAEDFAAIFGMPVEIRSLSELPPLSELLARRRCESTESRLDLVPPEWLQVGAERALKRRVWRSVAALAAVWLALVAGIIGYGAWERSAMRRYERRAEELKEPALKSLELQSRIEALEHYADRSRSALECLREVSVLLPPKLELQSFSFKKGSEVNLRGLSSSVAAADIYTYFQALEKSDKFEALADQRVNTVTRRGSGRVSQFQTKLILPAEEMQE